MGNSMQFVAEELNNVCNGKTNKSTKMTYNEPKIPERPPTLNTAKSDSLTMKRHKRAMKTKKRNSLTLYEMEIKIKQITKQESSKPVLTLDEESDDESSEELPPMLSPMLSASLFHNMVANT
mmetsp:Transcript_86737/g.106406  ORF Transcript_86737/g.106406 Transcript_86737/m.106406 type:complete len:122 (-) Transcript_86737:179-544(-)